jgi:NAD-dependent deacetylase
MSTKGINIVVLTGAGISAESGIPVFRSETGLWEQHKVEDVATYEGFVRNKNLVHDFYNSMRQKLKNITPNAAHIALAKLEKEWGLGKVTIITQNIDDLHEKANTTNVIHMHGELNNILCEHCLNVTDCDYDTSDNSECPICHNKSLRPNIVWFGEIPYYMDEIENSLNNVGIFISIGTSGNVYPAAGFARVAKANNAFNIEFNLDKTIQNTCFDKGVYGKASVTVPKFVDNLLKYKDLSFLNSM